MADTSGLPKELLERIAAVVNIRARFVLDSIVKNGIVTTEQINQAGYEHPPRAARDVRELGFRLKTIRVKHSNGQSIAAYMFDELEFEVGKAGRRLLPKKDRDVLVQIAGNKCQICGATHNLQVDHRIPYQVAGESQSTEAHPYQILCGSCNRKKSWDCEHCQNCVQLKSLNICLACYWAEPGNYHHVAMQELRRLDIVWHGEQIADFERIKTAAAQQLMSTAEYIKQILRSN